MPPTPSSSTRPHHRHSYYHVIEWCSFNESSLPLGWTSSPRVWNEVMNVVNCALKRAGICTLLNMSTTCSHAAAPKQKPFSLAKSSPRRSKLPGSQNLRRKASGRLLKSYKITSATTSPDSKGAGSLQLPERHCDVIRRAARHLLYQASQNLRISAQWISNTSPGKR